VFHIEHFGDVYSALVALEWLGSRVVSVLDSGAEGPGFKSQSRCCRVTALGKLFTPILPLVYRAAKLVAVLLSVGCGGNCRPRSGK